ncbi:MAG TPA: citrate synthase, partial [Spirochaetia bacterium]|nr:citrate synthase [Spirochaetia bacterium]
HGYIMDEGERVPVEGRLRYRGIDVRDIVSGFQKEVRKGYEEVAYLLLFGELPTATSLQEFSETLGSLRPLPDNFTEDMILKAPSSNIMNKLARSVLAYYSFDSNPEEESLANVLRQSITLIAALPTMTAYAYQAKRHYFDQQSLFLHAPRPEASTAENLLHMIRHNSEYSELEAALLDLCLVLHAEHGGGNNSAFTIHVVSSSSTDTYSAVAAAIGSLKGARHGGANIKVIEMMDDIKSNVRDWSNEGEVTRYIEKIIAKKAFDGSGLVYGMGHAVYTLSDPRAVLLKARAAELAQEKKMSDEMQLYQLVETLTPKVFERVKGSTKVIAANVDFYSGFVYSMLGIPRELFTPIFAISRISGWCAHRIEEILIGGRIIRPAYKCVIEPGEYSPLAQR